MLELFKRFFGIESRKNGNKFNSNSWLILKSSLKDENYKTIKKVFLEIDGKPVGLNQQKWNSAFSKISEEECSKLIQMARDYTSHSQTNHLKPNEIYLRSWISKFPSKNPPETKNFEKLLEIISFLLHNKFREECIGDIKETRQEMKKKGYSKWSMNTISCFKICSVIWSALRMRLSDLFDPEKENNN